MKFVEIAAPDFDLEKTLGSGQVFHWERVGNGFFGTIANQPIYLEQFGATLKIGAPSQLDRLKRSSSKEAEGPADELAETVAHYFALDHPLRKIRRSFPNDETMNAAKKFCRGLRIIRQPRWECLAMFICSSMKQVAHIRQISRSLRERFGDAHQIDKWVVHPFPSAERLAKASELELRECALGYRAKNLLATAKLVSSGEANLEAWSALDDVDLRERLCTLPGAGAKVANCVMLFAYERLRAFPVDVWIERTLRENYFARKRKPTATQLREFAASYFGEHGGYAQQYLFHHARTNKRARGAAPSSPAARHGSASPSMTKPRG